MNNAFAGRGAPVLPLLVMLGAMVAPHASSAQSGAGGDSCRSCHEALTVERLAAPVKAFQEDVHAGRGFGCADCHGGDPTVTGFGAMDPAKGFIGRPAGREVIQLCGRCHADAAFMRRYNPALRVDQAAEYATSIHGQRLLTTGDRKVATCVSCHPAHRIRPPGDPRSSVNPVNVARTCGTCHADTTYMHDYGIPTNQLERYERSVHWHALSVNGDRSAPTCNDCHGNHGAAPPGVTSVGNVCGQCHSVMADYFAASPHAPIFSRLGVPGCVGCHGNHAVTTTADTLLGVAAGSVCGRCHVAGTGGGITAAAMRTAIDSLRTDFTTADSLLAAAEHAGMEVSQPQFELRNAQTALLQARNAVHTFALDSVSRHVDEGLGITATAITRGRAALRDLRFRRVGLGVSTGIIVLLITGLVLKIRQLEGAGR
jgi:hypothetical protein